MKSLKEALIKKHSSAEFSKSKKIKDPKIGTWCYDYNGSKWKIESIYQYGKDDDPEQIEADMAMYDDTGFLDEVIELAEPGEFIVGVSNFGQNAVFIWAPEGCCYENK